MFNSKKQGIFAFLNKKKLFSFHLESHDYLRHFFNSIYLNSYIIMLPNNQFDDLKTPMSILNNLIYLRKQHKLRLISQEINVTIYFYFYA